MFDFFAISAWVTVLAFLLAIPMSIVGNILTPKALAWWATTSSRRRVNRIARLKNEIVWLATAKQPESIQQNLIKGLRYITYSLITGMYLFPMPTVLLLAMQAASDDVKPLAFLPREFLPVWFIRIRYDFLFVLILALISLIILFLMMAKNSFKYSSAKYLDYRYAEAERELRGLAAQVSASSTQSAAGGG